MSIYKTAINKPITTLLIFVGVIILGLFSLTRLPIDRMPEIELPWISVMTMYPGANGSEIETNVTKILENALNSVDGLKEIESTSKDNMSLVSLELEWGMDIDETINDVRQSVDMIYDRLPEGCSRPMILKFNSSMMPIMQYAITADESYPGLEKILEDNVINILNRIDGIGNVSLSGAPDRYVYIDLDPQKIDAYNLSVEAVGNAIAANNLNLASGSMKMGNEQYQVRVQGEYIESSEINNIVVTTTREGRQVMVKDIGVVRDTIKDVTIEEKINGKDGVRLVIMKQSGANTVQIARDVRKEMATIVKNLPPDIKVQMIYDSSEDIVDAINGLSDSIVYALLFVVIVILFFLGKWRASLIIGITIPISLVVSFVYLLFVDSTINIISLCSLTIAVGMVVDDAIVVLENITKHIDRGSSPREASIYATNEVWISVIATTLVIAAVFIPLTMIGGMAGVMFKELGWIVTIVVVTSTTVAITLTPMLCSRLLKNKKPETNHKKHRITYDNTIIRLLNVIDSGYSKLLRLCLRHKFITLMIVLGLFALSLVPVFLGKIGTDFMPQEDNGRFSVTAKLQTGTRIEQTSATARNIEKMIRERVPECILISTTAGSSDEAGVSALFSTANNNTIKMTVRCTKKYERERSIFEIAEAVRQGLFEFPEVVEHQVVTSGGGGGGSGRIDIEIYGYDFDKTNLLAQDIKHRMEALPGARNVTVNREDERAEIQIVFDKQKLAKHGLGEAMVSKFVYNRIKGMSVGLLKEDGEEYNIVARLKEDARNSITDIENFTIMTPTGQKIKLKELADISEYWCPPNIEHKRKVRIVTVQVTPVNISLSKMAETISAELQKVDIPQDIAVNIAGDFKEQQETFADLKLLLILVILLVYIVMASQFESFSKPFVIMMSIPFAISGVIVALLITGVDLDMIGALGAILLVGIVVKNGIVLVDYINLMRDRGYELNEAIALSGKSRLRPVLMTAATTILGMIPMVMSTSEGSEMWVPMGIVVIGGLTVSTLVTLIVVPVMYAIMSRRGERDKERKLRKKFIFMNADNARPTAVAEQDNPHINDKD